MRPSSLSSTGRAALSTAGLIALITSVAFFTADMRFPGWLALLPVTGAAAIVGAGPQAAMNRLIFSNRAAVFVGLISYPLYLWHWPLISYAYIVRAGRPPTHLMAAGLIVASFFLAWAAYRFVERLVRFGAHRHRLTIIAAVCVAALGAGGLAVWLDGGVPARFPSGLDIQKINAAKLDVTYQPTKGMDVTEYNTCIPGSECSFGIGDGYALVSHIGQGVARSLLLATVSFSTTDRGCNNWPTKGDWRRTLIS